MARKKVVDAPQVVTSKILIYNLEAYVLIDPGSIHLVISWNMASQFYSKHQLVGFDLNIVTLLGEIMVVNSVCRDYLICIDKVELRANLLLLPPCEFGVILGMEWLTEYYKIVNYFTKEVILESSN